MAHRTIAAIPLVIAFLLMSTVCPWALSAQGPGLDADMPDRFRAVDKGLRWLDAQQNTDGGFGEPASDAGTTCGVVFAFAAAYEEPGTVQEGTNSPLDYLASQVATYTSSAQGTARMILGVVAGNEDPGDFRGTDLVATLEGYRQPDGQYRGAAPEGIAAQALAIMALKASYQNVPSSAITWLKNRQNTDGGWGLLPDQTSDTENTSLSMQALIAVGESSASLPIADAIGYFHARQQSDSGFASSASASSSDAASTAQAIQALLAGGENLLSAEWSPCLRTPFDALLDFQTGSGSFADDLSRTSASVPALMGRSFPLPGRRLAAFKALEWMKSQQDVEGGFGDGGVTADAVYAIALCDQDPDGAHWTEDGYSALDALKTKTPDYIDSAPGGHPAGELAKVIRAVQAAEDDPTNFPPGRDLVAELKATYVESTGRYHPNKVFSHGLALLALKDVAEAIPAKAVTTLENARRDDGGWPWAWSGPTSDVDSTGRSMEALVAGGGPGSPAVFTDAAKFLQSLQFADGGFPDLANRPEANCNSTSLAIQGLLAADRYREEPLLFSTGGGAVASSWDALLAFQEQTGSFAFTGSAPESRLLATLDAIPALVSTHYPAYEPLAEGDETEVGTVSSRLSCEDGLQLVAPYAGDDDNDGWATLRYRVVGESSWTGPTVMDKRGLAYLQVPDLAFGADYEIEVAYGDPDGVSGENPQSMEIHVGRACIPLAMRGHGG